MGLFQNMLMLSVEFPRVVFLVPSVLFIIFINDLPEAVDSVCKVFADDTKLYNIQENSNILQNDLFRLLDWSVLWQLNFNVLKCCVLHTGKKNNHNIYYMNKDKTCQLKTVDQEKDVGVVFSNDLKFDKHINQIVNKANQITGIIKRSFSYIDSDLFNMLFKSTVRPHLEYANVIWHPLLKEQAVSSSSKESNKNDTQT